MAERTIREAHWGYYSFVLKSGVVAEKGNIAAFDTSDGSVVNAASGATFIPIGVFHESKVGDGIVKCQVKMWREIQLTWWDNDATTPAALTDRGKVAYLKDNHTVSMDGTGRSKAGMVFDVQTAKGVLVFFDYDVNP
jgi:hypothetical protein